jgi:hypothetical protein
VRDKSIGGESTVGIFVLVEMIRPWVIKRSLGFCNALKLIEDIFVVRECFEINCHLSIPKTRVKSLQDSKILFDYVSSHPKAIARYQRWLFLLITIFWTKNYNIDILRKERHSIHGIGILAKEITTMSSIFHLTIAFRIPHLHDHLNLTIN